MTITREDALRELELLPIWQLRAPVLNIVQNAEQKVAQNLAQKPNQEKAEDISQQQQNIPPAEIAQKPEPSFDYYVAENNACIFICLAGRMDTGLQSILFDNICIAMQIKAKKTPINLANCHAKVLIAMGETVAQTLLNSQESVENMRGKPHNMSGLTVIVTFDLAHLLANPLDKARTWQDLCLAQTFMQSLQTL